jgi:hypothetical protein
VLFLLDADARILGTVAVPPWLNGLGLAETRRFSLTFTVSLPWLTAAGAITRTAPLITTVPVRALTMTRAGASAASTSQILDLAHQRRRGFRRPGARRWRRWRRRSHAPGRGPAGLLIDVGDAAVPWSGPPSDEVVGISGVVAKPASTARSTVAPPAMRPLDGTLTVSFDPSAASTPSPPMTRLPCDHRVNLTVGAIKRREHQCAATQALGLADRRNGDVKTLTGFGKGRQIRR